MLSQRLVPRYYNNWLSPFNDDLRILRNMMELTDSNRPQTMEPSYRYEANEKGLYFEIELPGVAKENIGIEVDGHKLIVKGQRIKKKLGKAKETINNEVQPENSGNGTDGAEAKPTMTYALEVRLPQDADLNAIKADNAGDGILVLTIPKKGNSGRRTIQITE